MSYWFQMYFKQISSATEAIKEATRIVENLCLTKKKEGEKISTAEHIMRLYKNDIPSVVAGKINDAADEYWLGCLFSRDFVYWEKYHLFGCLAGRYDEEKEYFNEAVCFQDSSDQNYDFQNWSDKIDIFAESRKTFETITAHDLWCIAGEKEGYRQEELEEDMDYYRKVFLYQNIWEKLALQDWLYERDNEAFVRMRVVGFSSPGRRACLMNLLDKVREQAMRRDGVTIEKALFDKKVDNIMQKIEAACLGSTVLNEGYVNRIRTNALSLLSACDDFLLKDS